MAVTNAEPLAEKSLDLETGPSCAKLTAGEVAKLLKVHPTTVYKMAKRSELPGFKIASDWGFDPAQIQGWIRSRVCRDLRAEGFLGCEYSQSGKLTSAISFDKLIADAIRATICAERTVSV